MEEEEAKTEAYCPQSPPTQDPGFQMALEQAYLLSEGGIHHGIVEGLWFGFRKAGHLSCGPPKPQGNFCRLHMISNL